MAKMKRMKFKFQTVKNAADEILNEEEETKGMRIAERAVMQMQSALEDYARKLMRQSAVLANHTKRRTIKRDDVLLALSMINTKG